MQTGILCSSYKRGEEGAVTGWWMLDARWSVAAQCEGEPILLIGWPGSFKRGRPYGPGTLHATILLNKHLYLCRLIPNRAWCLHVLP